MIHLISKFLHVLILKSKAHLWGFVEHRATQRFKKLKTPEFIIMYKTQPQKAYHFRFQYWQAAAGPRGLERGVKTSPMNWVSGWEHWEKKTLFHFSGGTSHWVCEHLGWQTTELEHEGHCMWGLTQRGPDSNPLGFFTCWPTKCCAHTLTPVGMSQTAPPPHKLLEVIPHLGRL